MVSFSLPEVNWAGLVLPFAYIATILGTFVVFAKLYHKRQDQKAANLQPWFPPHLQRDVYLSLLHMDEETEGEEKPKKVPDSLVRAALLRRAVEDINRIIKIRTAKQSIQTLQERGSVGDELCLRFQRAEKEMEEELREVVIDANALVPNWGQYIFQTANAIASNEWMREKLAATQAEADEDRAWAAAHPTTPAPGLKEIAPASASLDTPAAASAASSRPSTPLTGTAAPEAKTPGSKKKSKK